MNGAIPATLALAADHFVSVAYTGGMPYARMGLLFASEWLHRRARFGSGAAR